MTGFSFLVCNLGLNAILSISIPILNAIYPVAIVLILLGLMLHTGLLMAQRSSRTDRGAENQLLLSTLSDLLSNELRYAGTWRWTTAAR